VQVGRDSKIAAGSSYVNKLCQQVMSTSYIVHSH